MMISVDEAVARIATATKPLEAVSVAIDESRGLVLAESVSSDRDVPAFDKSMVDGYAVTDSDLAAEASSGGTVELYVLEEVTAGATPTQTLTPGATTRIMTGAPLPPGTGAVVMIERSTAAGELVVLDVTGVVPGDNVMLRGSLQRAGAEALAAGARLGSAQIGLLAELGHAVVRTVPRPRVAVLATGNELVPAGEVPGDGQIRNSNGPMLTAAVDECGGAAIDLGIARDERDDLRQRIEHGLEADVLLLSGGVSAGVLDLVPEVLAELGVREVFHKVQLKPGKPLWFGVHGFAGHDFGTRSGGTLVFGLPGNPVSSFVCFLLFVRPAIARLAGRADTRRTRARLVDAFTRRRDRPTYHPAVLDESSTTSTVRLARWRGSADLAAFAEANCLAVLPVGDEVIAADTVIDVVRS
ncbi:MAG: molybdopterin molybdotransferase MoeA [Pirellulales bacterium]